MCVCVCVSVMLQTETRMLSYETINTIQYNRALSVCVSMCVCVYVCSHFERVRSVEILILLDNPIQQQLLIDSTKLLAIINFIHSFIHSF